jgi:hypothetical protein
MNLEDRAKGLLKLVESYRAKECREAIERASDEAREILRRAWRRERDHLHASVEGERARARSLIQAARAERSTRERSSGDRRNTRLLALAWPLLEARLQANWRDQRRREIWVSQALAAAWETLPVGSWVVRHAPDWEAPERAPPCVALAERLAGRGSPAPGFSADPQLTAGLVVESGAARLDASLEGLLQDRAQLEARLLALLAADSEAGDRPQAGDRPADPGPTRPEEQDL